MLLLLHTMFYDVSFASPLVLEKIVSHESQIHLSYNEETFRGDPLTFVTDGIRKTEVLKCSVIKPYKLEGIK